MSERAIFDAALEIRHPAQRKAYLDEICAGQPELRARVEALLQSHATAGSFLDVPAVAQLQPGSSPPFDNTAFFTPPVGESAEDEFDGAIDLGFLQPSTKSGSIGRLGHYEVLQVLGQGGFGIVFKSFDEKLQRLVAIKVMNPHIASTSPPRKRFLREARSAAAIRHENIVQVYSVEEKPLPYLVMEYVEGQTLQQKLDESGPLEAPEVLYIGRQIATGLAAAHAMGLIHRDIKPGNILLERGAEPKVKITDFGLARASDDASMTRTGVVSGTPMYMAPEQALGQSLDHRTDLFSFGSVLYQVACGRPPFRASTTVAVLRRVVEDTPRPMREILPDIPEWLVALVAKLHAKQPDERFQSAKEVAELLAACESELRLSGKVTSAGEVTRKSAASHLSTGAASESGLQVSAQSTTGSLITDRASRRIVALATCGLLLAALGYVFFGGQVFRFVTNQGELVQRLAPLPVESSALPDRRAAEYVMSIGGTLWVSMDRLQVHVKTLAELPNQPFMLNSILLSANTQVDDAGLVNFKDCQNLTHLYLDGTQIGDVGLATFKDCKNLTHLNLAYTRTSDAGLENFKDCKLDQLFLHYNTQITDVGLAHFRDCRLTHLYLEGTQVTDVGLAYFKNSKRLIDLSLGGTRVSDIGLTHFEGCTGLMSLGLHGTRVTDAGLANFKNCKSLTQLSLHRTQVSDVGLAIFGNCESLAYLYLEGTQVSDVGLKRIESCKSLMYLDVRNTKVSAAGIDDLQKVFPGCKIVWDDGVIAPKAAAQFINPVGMEFALNN